MKILGLKNSKKPIGLYSLDKGEQFVSLKLFELPVYTLSKYSIASSSFVILKICKIIRICKYIFVSK